MKKYHVLIINPNITSEPIFKSNLNYDELISAITILDKNSYTRIIDNLHKEIERVDLLSGYTNYDNNGNYLIYTIMSGIDAPNTNGINTFKPDNISKVNNHD